MLTCSTQAEKIHDIEVPRRLIVTVHYKGINLTPATVLEPSSLARDFSVRPVRTDVSFSNPTALCSTKAFQVYLTGN